MTPEPGARRATVASRPGRPRLAVAATVAVAVLAVVLVVVLVGGDDDGDPGGGADPTTSASPDGDETASAPPTEEPEDPTSPAALDERYAALATGVTTGFESCHAGKVREGQRERVVCESPAGTLELVTYRGAKALETRRDKAVTDRAGGVLDVRRAGILMAHEEEGRRDAPVAAFLYWDDTEALQSAVYFAEGGTDLDGLVALFETTDPVRAFPAGPSAPQLIDFADQWVDPTTCMRIETVNDGALEESYCDVKGPVEVYVGRFASTRRLEAYRRLVLASAIADEREVRDWNQREGDPPVGALYEYTTDSGSAVRYWDKPGCACYAEAYLADGSYADLKRWWTRDRR